jgi:hypothetical protein
VAKPLGVIEPMVGWKQAPLSSISSRLMVLISVFMPCDFELDIMNACVCLCVYKWFLY